ncbi:hypothetical protein C0W54_07415 [Photobacterium kishitanii]|uniref:hypothetical protein n=1 Tax=Photobacterium kishitanii TaxID=318456 RepID=UPI000D17853D|nr:hypothetical protein [Photobacterium kishitanii]PSW62151.1 hypothetical protein C0W54_07415 [Photobacterium kishitanii]
MSTVSRTYSAYQKKVIRALSKLVGSRAFRYEKTQNSHLKIHIEGVDKPVFTSSTPSDRKALENFMSQVRMMIRAAEKRSPLEEKVFEEPPKQPHVCNHEKMINSIVKNMRLTAVDLQDKEVEIVLEQESVDGISEHRQQLIKKSIGTVLSRRKGERYLTPSVMRCIEKDISHHVNFILPTVAHYAELLGKSKIDEKSRIDEETEMVQEKETLALGDMFQLPLKPYEPVTKESKQKIKPVKKPSRMAKQHVGEDNMSMLMTLMRIQSLMDDLKQAIVEKHEEEIDEQRLI